MKSRNPSVSANAEPAPLAGEPKCIYSSRSRPERPSSVSLTRASSPGGEALGSPCRGARARNSQPLPPEGEAQKTGAAWMAAPVS